MLLGVIADDFTGASDIAVTLAKGLQGQGGLKTAQFLGVPDQPAPKDIEAGVVALKSRSIPAAQAIEQSLAACRWLKEQGCQQILFKYCSTFDSTPAGNIGPVAEALAVELGAEAVVVCPSFPSMGRTVYQGHLFVNGKLLSESGMQNHPVTPMTDPDIRRVLQAQSQAPTGFIAWQVVRQGSDALEAAFDASRKKGERLTVVDAIEDEDLVVIGKACRSTPLLTGGSGIARGLPRNFIDQGLAAGVELGDVQVKGGEAILVGSCSGATLGQIVQHGLDHPMLMITVKDVLEGSINPIHLVSFVLEHLGQSPLVYSSGEPEEVKVIQQKYGQEIVSAALDELFGETARLLVQYGVRRIVVGGGETSGAVVSALKLGALTIGAEIDIGVPALLSSGSDPVALALKSGNFGSKDFFAKAVKQLGGNA
ncbi:3-oxo-tetronate kinase [Pseudomonas sp.]|uniref:3-oxo-tetronate kinase n=1 Tax=Pseudomonas sp. TaxID=306 RepID=UPI003F3C05C5